MDYVPHADADVAAMLEAVGAAGIEDLFAEIPEEVRLRRPLNLPVGASEAEVLAELRALAARTTPASEMVSFLGAGVYDHFVPAVVDALVGRSEFQTAYTPYQPERSQGVLQSVFEFQTAICELTGMEVANASMYDAGTALAEASFLAGAQTRRGTVVVSDGVHPEYREVLATESVAYGPRPVAVGLAPGARTDGDALRAAVDADTAALVVQQPNFFGALEDVAEAARVAHKAGALLVVVADPVALGLLEAPGALGADIVVGEGQSFGNPMSYGGPGLGFMAVTSTLVRRLPGRLVGETRDRDGRRGFVLTLQTREQHIRREKATSNICSNHALNALAALVHLVWLGKRGLPELAETCLRRAAYLRARLLALPGVTAFTQGPVFREFAVRLPMPAKDLVDALVPKGFLAGVPLGWAAGSMHGATSGAGGGEAPPGAAPARGSEAPPGAAPARGSEAPPGAAPACGSEAPPAASAGALDDVLLVAVTEKRTKAEIDAFVEAVAEVIGRG